MTPSDETLMAYLDNELSPDEHARVDALIAADPQVKARLERQARLHAMLSAAFDPAIRQPVPERLVSAAMTTRVAAQWHLREGVSRLFSRSDAGLMPRYALAMATLLIGVGLGWSIPSVVAPESDEPLVARGELANALSHRLASDSATTGPRVGVSFRSKSGSLCRTFETGAATDNVAGVACHDAGAWIINTLARTEPRNGVPYEVAGAGMPPAVRSAVAGMIAGAPLDAEQERRARDQGWREPR